MEMGYRIESPLESSHTHSAAQWLSLLLNNHNHNNKHKHKHNEQLLRTGHHKAAKIGHRELAERETGRRATETSVRLFLSFSQLTLRSFMLQ